MAGFWSGSVIFTRRNDDRFDVSLVAPAGVKPGTDLLVYDGKGPGLPKIGTSQTAIVTDPKVWINDRQGEGFSFTEWCYAGRSTRATRLVNMVKIRPSPV